jgi:hypothetical protein
MVHITGPVRATLDKCPIAVLLFLEGPFKVGWATTSPSVQVNISWLFFLV